MQIIGECHFCYNPSVFIVLFSKGREIDICDDVMCFHRLVEVSKEEDDEKIHSIEVREP